MVIVFDMSTGEVESDDFVDSFDDALCSEEMEDTDPRLAGSTYRLDLGLRSALPSDVYIDGAEPFMPKLHRGDWDE